MLDLGGEDVKYLRVAAVPTALDWGVAAESVSPGRV